MTIPPFSTNPWAGSFPQEFCGFSGKGEAQGADPERQMMRCEPKQPMHRTLPHTKFTRI